jgi:hypothetical protein
MKSLLIILTFSCFTLVGCNNSTNSNAGTNKNDTAARLSNINRLADYEPKWLDSSYVILAIDTFLSHRQNAFKCDSAIMVDYNGGFGEHSYLPLNEKGQWINTIKRRKKLSVNELQFIKQIFGNKSTFKDPLIIGCYEPGLGIIYFKDNKVIAQSAICIGCARIQSTATLGSGDSYASFNEKTKQKLVQFYSSLKF